MCGIAGIYRLNKSIQLFSNPNVLELLRHRGPDAQKFSQFDDAILYHTRLSIIDLSEYSHQPFHFNNKSLVFNGEIFNYHQLANQIGISNPKSDTEVLIQYFDRHQINSLQQLQGFFAFAFYDNIKQELFVIRDRYGEKPLYYYHDENIFAFASEIFPLLQLIQKKLSVNKDALYTYFRLHYIAGEQSILNGIKRLLPGHYIHIQNNAVSIKQWYSLQKNKPDKNLSFEMILSDAVQKRLISDAPVGAFLSGGIDSSVVCALAKQYKNDLHTFSLGYKNEKLYNETNDAITVANYIGSIHHNFEITADEIISQIPDLLNLFDEPFADSSAINVFFLSKKIKEYATVALSGDGADELLMGYNKHKIFLLKNSPLFACFAMLIYPAISIFPESRSHRFFNHIRKLKKLLTANRLSSLKKYIYLSQWADDAYIHQLFHTSLNNQYFFSLFEKYNNLSEAELFNLADMEIVLTNDMLYKTDYFGMLNAVEIRSPFLDHHVAEYLFHSPFENKIYESRQKYLLRQTFEKLLPASVFSKKKSGFEIPLHKILPPIIQKYQELQKDYIIHQKIFNLTMIEKLQEQLKHNTNDAALKLWTILIFQAWYKKFEPYIDNTL